jgi:hypothetical protein
VRGHGLPPELPGRPQSTTREFHQAMVCLTETEGGTSEAAVSRTEGQSGSELSHGGLVWVSLVVQSQGAIIMAQAVKPAL